jgi:hypothetical protein
VGGVVVLGRCSEAGDVLSLKMPDEADGLRLGMGRRTLDDAQVVVVVDEEGGSSQGDVDAAARGQSW